VSGTVLRRTLARHVLLTVVVAVVLSALTTVGVWRYAERDASRTAERVARQIASAVLVPLSQRDFTRLTAGDRESLLGDLAPFLGSGMIDRVKVFTVAGAAARIEFSDEQRIEGHTGTLRPELAAQLERGEVVVQPVPADPEHAYERSLPGERLEVYFAFRDAGGADTRLEVYVPVSVAATTRQAVADLVPLVLAGLLLLALATVPLSLGLARRIERDRAEQRAVRRYGLAAAELARRDLAQRLHDGVIPDLAGVGLLLEALGAQRPDQLVDRVQGLVAEDVRALRGLLDDLVPAAEDPESALRATAEQARRSVGGGPPVEVAVSGTFEEETAVLVVRVAGELVRNAVRHAGADTVRVELAERDGTAVLTVRDDGRGFDPSTPRRTGHVGLQLVQRVAADAGGRVAVDSAPGAGTLVRVELPRRGTSARDAPRLSARGAPRPTSTGPAARA
jgi:two-component system, NarL family, sensor kinase